MSPSRHSSVLALLLLFSFLSQILAWGPGGGNGFDWSQGGGGRPVGGGGSPVAVGGPVPQEDSQNDSNPITSTTQSPNPPPTSSPSPSPSPTTKSTTTTSSKRDTTALEVETETLVDVQTVIASTLSSSTASSTQLSASSIPFASGSGVGTFSSTAPVQSSSGFKGASNANLPLEDTNPSGSSQSMSGSTISIQSGAPKWHDFSSQVQFGVVAKTGAAPSARSPLSLLAILSFVAALQISRALR